MPWQWSKKDINTSKIFRVFLRLFDVVVDARKGLANSARAKFLFILGNYALIRLTSEANDVWSTPDPAEVLKTDDLQRTFSEMNQIFSSAIDCS